MTWTVQRWTTVSPVAAERRVEVQGLVVGSSGTVSDRLRRGHEGLRGHALGEESLSRGLGIPRPGMEHVEVRPEHGPQLAHVGVEEVRQPHHQCPQRELHVPQRLPVCELGGEQPERREELHPVVDHEDVHEQTERHVDLQPELDPQHRRLERDHTQGVVAEGEQEAVRREVQVHVRVVQVQQAALEQRLPRDLLEVAAQQPDLLRERVQVVEETVVDGRGLGVQIPLEWRVTSLPLFLSQSVVRVPVPVSTPWGVGRRWELTPGFPLLL